MSQLTSDQYGVANGLLVNQGTSYHAFDQILRTQVFEELNGITAVSFVEMSDFTSVEEVDLIVSVRPAFFFGAAIPIPGGLDVEALARFPGQDSSSAALNNYFSTITFNSNSDTYLSAQNLFELGAASTTSFVTAHEIGHSLGLTHFSLEVGTPLPIAPPELLTLNNHRYTTQGQNGLGIDANATPLSESNGLYGSTVGFMAIDIAALQYIYGANSHNISDTTYYLSDGAQILTGNLTNDLNAVLRALDIDGGDGVESVGRAYRSIWDANVDLFGPIDPNNTGLFGGNDTLSYEGSLQSAWINLNDATLDISYNLTDIFAADFSHDLAYVELRNEIVNSSLWDQLNDQFKNEIDATVADVSGLLQTGSYHAGGFFSQLFTWAEDAGGNNTGVASIQDGGYSIANGVMIENASGGENDDVLIGNEYANGLMGNGGNDYLFGGSGNDTIYGGTGDDTIYGGSGDDILTGGEMPADDGSGGFIDFFFHTVFGASKESKDQVDTFVFEEGFGNDTITDFYAQSSNHDIIALNLGSDFDTFAEVMAVAQRSGNDVFFDFGNGDTLTLLDVKLNHLSADDFAFI